MKIEVVVLLAALGVASQARSAQLDARELNILANDLVLQHELTFLNATFDWDTVAVQQFETAATVAGWQTRLHGLHNGKQLDVTYTGTYAEQTSTQSLLTYSGSGTYGTEPWSSVGSFTYTEFTTDEDWSGSGGLASGGGLGCQVGVSGRYGLISINVSLQKDATSKMLEASIGIGVIDVPYLGSLWNTGGKFKLDQSTGEDQFYVFTDIAWGLYTREKSIGDRTHLFRDPDPPQNPTPPVRRDTTPPYPYTEPPWDPPANPPGATPGTNGMSPGDTLYDHGYVGAYETPEPAASLLVLTPFLFARRR